MIESVMMQKALQYCQKCKSKLFCYYILTKLNFSFSVRLTKEALYLLSCFSDLSLAPAYGRRVSVCAARAFRLFSTRVFF